MSSKRMAISALLSNDASTSHPPSPTLAPTSDEPPMKRQRHQQHFENYSLYPPNTSSSPTLHYYPPQLQHQLQLPSSATPAAIPPPIPQTWPSRRPTSLSPQEPRTQWDDALRRIPASSVASSGALDFGKPHRRTSNLRGAEDDDIVDGGRGGRDVRFQPLGVRKGRSIGGVLTDQMRAQTHTALPVPPQLRRDAQHSQPAYIAPTAVDSPSRQPVLTRDTPSLAIKTNTPRATPPSLSPRSSYNARHVSPTASYTTHSISPTSYVPQSMTPTAYPRQNIPPTTPSSPKVSPTAAYQSSERSPHIQLPSASYVPTGEPSTESYTPLLPGPSAPSFSRDPATSSTFEPMRSPLSPLPPPVTPHHVLVPEGQKSPMKPSGSAPMAVDDERSFEDELLSLVDGEDRKPKISRPPPQLPPSESSNLPGGHKPSGGSAKSTAKSKPQKSRVSAKSSKTKTTPKQESAAGTPVPASSMPPPSPTPTKQPSVARPKGKVTAIKKKPVGTSAVRARSLSVKPAESTPAPDVEITHEDDRLYCTCRKSYDEDKVMIACDRCDEWYHPACVGMPEVEVDLVDQYICELCAKEKVGLRTTYKARCHRGLNYIASHDTLPTCWKPARGAFSKYCSDDCGMAHMRAKILQSGRDAASLWPTVKNARRREGVTITNGPVKIEETDADGVKEVERKKAALAEARKALKEADERELAELLRRLDEIMGAREACKAALERVVLRRRLLDFAVERASGRCCGWDVRLEMNDEEWTRWAATEEGRCALDGKEKEDREQWWCQGPEKCPRHNGWRNIRDLDVQVEVDSKNSSIKQLTDRERELRRRIEDINPPSVLARQHKAGGRKKNQGKRTAR